MSSRTFHAGTAYAAAIDWPWYLPESSAVSALESEGWRVISVEDCAQARLPFELPAGCGDKYDTVGVGIRTGPTYERELPEQFIWTSPLGKEPTGPPPGPGGQPAPPGTGVEPATHQAAVASAWATGVLVGAGGVALVAGLGALGYHLLR